MAGALTISTLNNDTGVLATQNGMTGIAKAWVNFDGSVSTPTLRSNFNVSSVTKNGTGDYTLNFTTSMPNANYVMTGGCASNTFDDNVTYTWKVKVPSSNQLTGSCRINTVFANVGSSGNYADFTNIYVAVFSS